MKKQSKPKQAPTSSPKTTVKRKPIKEVKLERQKQNNSQKIKLIQGIVAPTLSYDETDSAKPMQRLYWGIARRPGGLMPRWDKRF